MASIRRMLSPYQQDRPNLNGGSPILVQSSAFKVLSDDKCTPSFLIFGGRVQKLLGGVFLQKYPKKKSKFMEKFFPRCLLFFFLGFLLGMTRFGGVEDVAHGHFSFEIKPATVNVQQDVEEEAISRPENYVVDIAELEVEKRLNTNEAIDFLPRKQLIVVTPTYNRAIQAYYLNRLGQVLRLVRPPLLWIVVEMNSASTETAEILRNTGVMYRHLVCVNNFTNTKERQVRQRNTALEHIELHKLDGVVYFADEDNIYSIDLFENMRKISRLGTWSVAMLAQSRYKAILEGPVCNESQVIGWHTNVKSKRLRRFHIFLSGFGFNSTLLWDPKRWHNPTADPLRLLGTVKEEGYQETKFIEKMVENENQIESIPAGCSKIMNWHLSLDGHNLVYPKGWLLKEENTDAACPIEELMLTN